MHVSSRKVQSVTSVNLRTIYLPLLRRFHSSGRLRIESQGITGISFVECGPLCSSGCVFMLGLWSEAGWYIAGVKIRRPCQDAIGGAFGKSYRQRPTDARFEIQFSDFASWLLLAHCVLSKLTSSLPFLTATLQTQYLAYRSTAAVSQSSWQTTKPCLLASTSPPPVRSFFLLPCHTPATSTEDPG